jgi:hypothetical protein
MGRCGGQVMSNDDQVIKQYPFDLKAEATANGYRIHGHVYADTMDDAVTDLANMISKAITEFERIGLPLMANAQKVIAK